MPTLSLRAVLNADGRGFFGVLDKAGSAANRLGSQFGGSLRSKIASAFTVGAVMAFSKSVIEAASTIADSAERVGLSTTKYQQYAFAAEQGGVKNDAFAESFDRLTNTIDEAKKKGGDALLVLQRLGAVNVQNSSVEKIADDIINFVSRAEVTDQMRADLLDAFGKRGAKLIPVFKNLRETVKETPLFTEGEIKRLDEAGDRMNKMWKAAQVGGAGFTIMGDAIVQTADSIMNDILGKNKEAKMGFLERFFMPLDPGGSADFKARLALLEKQEAEIAEKAGKPKTAQQIKEEEKERNELAKERLKLERELNEAKLESLGPEARIAELQKQKIKFQQDFWDAIKGSNEELSAQIGIQKTDNEIADIRKGIDKKKKGDEIPTDSLAKVGNFLGGGAGLISGIAEKQLSETKAMHKTLKDIKVRLETPAGSDLSSNTPPT